MVFCKESNVYAFTHNQLDSPVVRGPWAGCGMAFGLGGTDTASLYDSTSTLVSSPGVMSGNSDSITWGVATDGSCSGACTGANLASPTPGAPNALGSFLYINEAATKGDSSDSCAGDDWIELYNPTASPITLTGMMCAKPHAAQCDRRSPTPPPRSLRRPCAARLAASPMTRERLTPTG